MWLDDWPVEASNTSGTGTWPVGVSNTSYAPDYRVESFGQPWTVDPTGAR